MKILAIDTATEACSAALYIDGEAINSGITTQYQLAPRQHSRLILQMADDLLKQAAISINALDAIAFGRGPGSFMGLRIAAGVVQGIAFAHELPVIPVSTLKTMAQRVYQETGNSHVLAAIDARMDEVYWAAYTMQDQRWCLHGAESVISPDNVILPEMPVQSGENQSDPLWVGAGTGWSSYKDRLLLAADCQLSLILPECFPSAEAMVKLAAIEFAAGNTVLAAEAIPVYLRNDVAKKPKPVTL
ncbi:MAG: tRNA (adenosine(37)-N6)-threonylcarbamoyltransferase complex dimerization subunit type 1 TsaB [Gammaproteobacteria bacterium]|nr:tRNA (adenosine(37)-N6)-threonylcarbamoyltransferase complex dimerization subunit type 1 TsaB [Gammaproteobacteria bacterium]